MTPELVREVFEYRSGRLLWRKKIGKKVIVGTEAGTPHSDGYITIRAFKKRFYAHRLIWIMHHGEIPADLVIDHINHDPSDNRVENLRLVTKAQNVAHRRGAQANSKSGIRGVSWVHRDRMWRVDVRNKCVGRFGTIDEAARAAEAARKVAFINPGGV
ncbi:MAG TPA: HNH endonuclease signature motif containing protein [Opitutaceae bacterium]|nr:HNH endonuclease signature motif containing protein [Opitutaceae bacterium]